MAVNRSKEAALKKPAPESKAVEPKAEVAPKPVEAKTEAPATEAKTDAAPKKQGMGEGQKAVTKAYKDNWNDIFGKKRKR
jgi:hypothetical protein